MLCPGALPRRVGARPVTWPQPGLDEDLAYRMLGSGPCGETAPWMRFQGAWPQQLPKDGAEEPAGLNDKGASRHNGGDSHVEPDGLPRLHRPGPGDDRSHCATPTDSHHRGHRAGQPVGRRPAGYSRAASDASGPPGPGGTTSGSGRGKAPAQGLRRLQPQVPRAHPVGGQAWKSGAEMKKGPEAPFLRQKRSSHFTRLRYSSVRVSISIWSPISTKAGTISSKPVPILAGFNTLPEVSPLTAGSV